MSIMLNGVAGDSFMGCTDKIPADFIRPDDERPKKQDLGRIGNTTNLIVIDLGNIHGPGRAGILKSMETACKTRGFFQVINHRISEELLSDIIRVAHEFFNLPMESKTHLCSEDPSKPVRLSTSFNVAIDRVKSWRQYLRLHCHPLADFVEAWPSQPPNFRDVVARYCMETRSLTMELFELICESLDLHKDFLRSKVGDVSQHMAMNFYPRCPQPELTLGVTGHFDPTIITLLLQGDVPGLQVMKDGEWASVSPLRNSFVVNVGDQLQALTNGFYKSGYHRALVNSSQLRVCIPTFIFPPPSALIEPPESLCPKIDRECIGVTCSRSFTVLSGTGLLILDRAWILSPCRGASPRIKILARYGILFFSLKRQDGYYICPEPGGLGLEHRL